MYVLCISVCNIFINSPCFVCFYCVRINRVGICMEEKWMKIQTIPKHFCCCCMWVHSLACLFISFRIFTFNCTYWSCFLLNFFRVLIFSYTSFFLYPMHAIFTQRINFFLHLLLFSFLFKKQRYINNCDDFTITTVCNLSFILFPFFYKTINRIECPKNSFLYKVYYFAKLDLFRQGG